MACLCIWHQCENVNVVSVMSHVSCHLCVILSPSLLCHVIPILPCIHLFMSIIEFSCIFCTTFYVFTLLTWQNWKSSYQYKYCFIIDSKNKYSYYALSLGSTSKKNNKTKQQDILNHPLKINILI